MPSLLDKRLVLVTGKGGVGKTTVAAALGLIAARRGKRVVLCEVAEQTRLGGMLGRLPHEGLHLASVDPERAKEEWLQLPAQVAHAGRSARREAGCSST